MKFLFSAMKFRQCSLRHRPARHGLALVAGLALALAVSGCANPALSDAQELNQGGQYEQALKRLEQASHDHPDDLRLRSALAKQRETTLVVLISQAQSARNAGQLQAARDLLARARAIDPKDPRAGWIEQEMDSIPRHQHLLEQAQKDLDKHLLDGAEDAVRTVISEDPSNTQARELMARTQDAREAALRRSTLPLKAAGKTVTLEFRDASLRNVFEALSRAAGVNFVFDKDVRADSKVSLMLRNTTVDEAMRLILSTQQLERKILDDNTVLIYQANAQKQREYQDLVTRSFYLVNADAKQVQSMIRTMTKTRDIYEDDRLNMLIVRDRPEALRLVEQLIQQVDLPEPEVMLDVQVMEVSTSVIDKLGLNYPNSVNYGIVPDAGAAVSGTSPTTYISSLKGLRTYVANPLVTAQLTGSAGDTNILASPRIRARNHEKAHVQLGDKVPVFTTTAYGSTGTLSSSVSYLDVGLKLDIEPTIQLDQDVIMKVALEVSNVANTVTGPDGTIAYQIGTRQATTSLRLKDGETQILAGLINDSDTRNSTGLPYLNRTPVLGPLFGVQSHDREKTELVLLITPHIVRNTPLPYNAGDFLASGTDAMPGTSVASPPSQGTASLAMSGAQGSFARPGLAPRPRPQGQDAEAGGGADAVSAPPAATGGATLSGPEQAFAGSGFQVNVRNTGNDELKTQLSFDPGVLQSTDPNGQGGRIPVDLGPGQSRAFNFMVKPQAPAAPTTLSVDDGPTWDIQVLGQAPTPAPGAAGRDH